MTGLASIAAIGLALILAWSATAKLRRPGETARQFGQLGLPMPDVLARAVPATELIVAVLLVVVPGWGGVAGFALLAAFTLLLVGIVRSGRVVGCGCFGSSSAEPVSWVEIVRNLWLMAMAAAAATLDGLAAPSFPEVVSATALTIIAGVTIELTALKRDAGAVFTATLAGELVAEHGAESGAA